MFICGDFNCRVGAAGDVPAVFVESTSLFDTRLSNDAECSTKGSTLVEFMEVNSFALLNGRTSLDRPAQFTYTGVGGNSVIDLVWCNTDFLSLVDNLVVLAHSTLSDHSPVLLSIFSQYSVKTPAIISADSGQQRNVLVWSDSLANIYRNMMEVSGSVGVPEGIQQSYINMCAAIVSVASALGLVRVAGGGRVHSRNKPWFNGECIVAKRSVKQHYKECRANNFSPAYKSSYVESKKNYRGVIKRSKKLYFDEVASSICQVKNQKLFWRTVNSFRQRVNRDLLSVEEWERYYSGLVHPRAAEPFLGRDALHPVLDREISMSELLTSLTVCKSNKSPGSDSISYEFVKNLPQNWLLYICCMFNRILAQETVPAGWRETILTMLHKKGPYNDPTNYRGIALLNSLEKIFSQILLGRLADWAEASGVLPECQSGFRRGRGCADNVFTLTSAVQINLRLKNRKVFAIFVDFRRAFDSVSHGLLWRKLHTAGVSCKLIRIIKNLYDGATMRIRVENSLSRPFPILSGVLQGEPLSPLLFSLFLFDIETYFRSRGAAGINLDNKVDLLMLLYADDLVIFADSEADVRRKLQVLRQYTGDNSLEINTSKTKIMCFRKSGFATNKRYKFAFEDQAIEVVNNYTYLGCEISSSLLFLNMAKAAVTKSRQTIGATICLMSRAKFSEWDSRMKLFESVVVSSLHHCLPVWGLRYLDLLERTQVGFFKRLLLLPRNTADYMVRLEVGVTKISHTVFRLCLAWIEKLLSMADSRLPKICFTRLRALNIPDAKYNWFLQVAALFEYIDHGETWSLLSHSQLKNSRAEMLSAFRERLRSDDLSRVNNSSFSVIYRDFQLSASTQPYLTLNGPIKCIRLFAQLRLKTDRFIRVCCNGCFYTVNCFESCTICNLQENETLEHVLFNCPIYNYLRPSILRDNNHCNIFRVLAGTVSFPDIRSVYNFFCNAMKIRSFVMNE